MLRYFAIFDDSLRSGYFATLLAECALREFTTGFIKASPPAYVATVLGVPRRHGVFCCDSIRT